MATKDWVDIAQLGLNLLLATFTLFLFRQGQRDRGKVRVDQERDQASKVSVIRSEETKPTSGGGFSIRGVSFEIRNDSSLPVTGVRLFHCRTSRTPEEDLEWKELDLDNNLYRGMSLPGGQHKTFAVDAALMLDDLELYFVDGAGRAWVRRESDGTLWVNTNIHPQQRWWQSWLRRRAAGTFGIVYRWPITHTFSRAVKVAPRIPWEARVTRFLWGSATAAEVDPRPWRRPNSVPERDWPYQNLLNQAQFRRERSTAKTMIEA
ncbi:hypothetical protein GCM10010052_18580 [Paenarthrobacter histidinolovorans]|nr:hypothetical protein GCM10010052_18580 [Paenarthrobacter histidinolovorans]